MESGVVGKRGTVTDLASVSLRSISVGVETKHHKRQQQHTPSDRLRIQQAFHHRIGRRWR